MATLTENTNLLQQAGFKVVMDRKNYPNFEFFAQSFSHPGVNIPAAENVTTSRIQTVPMPGDTLTFEDISVTILVDEDFNSYTEIFNWMVRLVNEKHTSPYDAMAAGVAPSTSDMKVTALSSHNNVVKTFTYRDAFPVSIGSIDFEANTSEYITLPVTFRYTYFEIT